MLLADLVVDLAPPDLVLAPGLADDELVLGRAARVLAGPDDERALGGDGALAGADRALVQLGDGEVGQDAAADAWALGRASSSSRSVSSTAARATRARGGSVTGRA